MSVRGLLRGFEPWMVSNVAVGAATASFLTLLVPPFITSVTGSAQRVGIVFAAISLSAVVGPLIGRLAERTRRHRLIYLVSLLAMGASFVLLAIDAHSWRWSPLFGVILGASYAAQGTLGPAFIVGVDQTRETVAAQLTAFNLAYPVGQLLGALAVAAAQWAGASAAATFWLAAAVMFAMTLLTWPTMTKPTRRLAAAHPAANTDETTTPAEKNSLRYLLVSAFGTFLFVVVLSSVGNNGLTSQLANVMPAVYGFTASQTSLLLGLAGLVNVFAIVYAGRKLARDGAFSVFTIGTAIRAVGASAMAIVGLATSPVLILAALAMLVTYQGTPIPRVAAPDLAAELSPVSAAEANGYYFAASAIGSVIGCLLAGYLADHISFNAVNWMAAIASALGLLTLIGGRRRRSSGPAPVKA